MCMVQETPGLHHSLAQPAILSYINAQLQQWLHADQDPSRGAPVALMKDPRVDVCLYFIAPHALKPQDVAFMQELSALVPVIPVLAKVINVLSPLSLHAHTHEPVILTAAD